MDTAISRRYSRLIVLLAWCLLLMLAWGLWMWRLDASDLAYDESVSYVLGKRALPDIISYVRGAVRENPPGYYLLVHVWMTLVGSSEFTIRLLSVGIGLIALALIGWVARLAPKCFGGLSSILPAFFLTMMPGMAYYSRDARMYSVVVALTLLSAGVFVRYWLPTKGWPRPTGLVGLTAVHLAALFTHYFLLLPILVQPLALLLLRRWKPLLAWCGMHIVPTLAGLAWLAAAPGLRMTTSGVGPVLALPTPFQLLHLLGKLLFSPVLRVQFQLLYVLLALIGAGLVLAVLRHRTTGVWLILSFAVSLALIYSLLHIPAPRYVLFVTPFMALALGFLCVAPTWSPPSLPRWAARGTSAGMALIVALLLVEGGLLQAITSVRSRYGHTLEVIKAYARPGDGMLFYGPWQSVQLEVYDPGGLPPAESLPPVAPPTLDPAQAEPVLRDLLGRFGRIWVLPAAVDDVDPDHFVAGWLRTHAHRVWKKESEFELYLPPLGDSAPTEDTGLLFGGMLGLERVAYEPQPVPAGEAFRITLFWRPLQRLKNGAHVTLTLVDQDNQIWNLVHSIPGEWGAPPASWEPGQVTADYEGLIVPQGAPPGLYTLRLAVTDQDTGAPLLVEGKQEIELLTIQVAGPARAPVLLDLPNAATTRFCSPDGQSCLTLAGYEPGGLRFQQGNAVPLTLHWKTQDAPARSVQLRLRLLHDPGLPWSEPWPVVTTTLPLDWNYPSEGARCQATQTVEPQPPSLPQSEAPFRVMLPLVLHECIVWIPDRLLTLPIALTLPLDAPTGRASVILEVLGENGGSWSIDGGETVLPLFKLEVDARPVLRRLPRDLTAIQVDLGDEMSLRGYRVEGEARPGGELRITYAWYARKHPTAIYAVFNHLIASDGTLVAQADGWPLEGRMLTIQWQAGEYVEDSYRLAIPSEAAAPGPYVLYTGLYDAATGERLAAFQDGELLSDSRIPIPLPGGTDR